MELDAGDICRLAADFAAEHGDAARDYARRAIRSFESEGAIERARFWRMMSAILDDIALRRFDPNGPIIIH